MRLLLCFLSVLVSLNRAFSAEPDNASLEANMEKGADDCPFDSYCYDLEFNRRTTDSFPYNSLTELVLRSQSQLNWTEKGEQCEPLLDAVIEERVEHILPSWVAYSYDDPQLDEFNVCKREDPRSPAERLGLNEQELAKLMENAYGRHPYDYLGYQEFFLDTGFEEPPNSVTFRKFETELNGEDLIWLEITPYKNHRPVAQTASLAALRNVDLNSCLSDLTRNAVFGMQSLDWEKEWDAPLTSMVKSGIFKFKNAIFAYQYSFNPSSGTILLGIYKQKNLEDRTQFMSDIESGNAVAEVCYMKNLDFLRSIKNPTHGE